jgi:hypothetical protein
VLLLVARAHVESRYPVEQLTALVYRGSQTQRVDTTFNFHKGAARLLRISWRRISTATYHRHPLREPSTRHTLYIQGW